MAVTKDIKEKINIHPCLANEHSTNRTNLHSLVSAQKKVMAIHSRALNSQQDQKELILTLSLLEQKGKPWI